MNFVDVRIGPHGFERVVQNGLPQAKGSKKMEPIVGRKYSTSFGSPSQWKPSSVLRPKKTSRNNLDLANGPGLKHVAEHRVIGISAMALQVEDSASSGIARVGLICAHSSSPQHRYDIT